MNYFTIIFVAVLCICHGDKNPQKSDVGKPIFNLEAAGAGKDLKNFQAGYNVGLGTKVWQKKDKSLELGLTYGRNIARFDGHTFKSKPVYGIGGTFRWGKK